MVHLSDARFQRTEDGRIRKERNDRRDDELGVRKKWREGTESVDIRRVESKSDFLVSFSKLSGNVGGREKNDSRKLWGILPLYKRGLRRSPLPCRLVMLSVRDGHEEAWNVW